MHKFLFVISFILALKTTAQRQFTSNQPSWFMYFGSHKISQKWGLHLEAQLRRNEFISKPQQLLFRTGLNYHFNANAFATVGYAFVETYPYGGLPAKSSFPENRLWEQIQLKNQQNSFEIISRFRLEQRFVKSPIQIGQSYEPGEAIFTNRFRILNRISLPFKGKTIVDKSLYISAYDEMMVNFGKNVALNIFDQNRAYLALGYKIPKLGRLEIGYLNQLLFKGDGKKVENNNTLQIGLSSTLDFYKKK